MVMNDVLKVDVRIDPDDAVEGAYGILKFVKPTWDRENIKSKIFSDGITNKMFGFYFNDDEANIVLVRVNGSGTEIYLDRDEEVNCFELLHKYDCAPSLYCIFNNGLCYEYLIGVTLTTQTVTSPDAYIPLVEELAKMHSIPATGDSPPKPIAFSLMRKFLKIAFECTGGSNSENRVSLKEEELRKEIDELESRLVVLNSPIMFCHNDLLIHNVIHNTEEGKVTFIDYEYAGFNYQAFDIGNHFCEFAGVTDIDYSLYPGKDFQLKWLRCYVKALQRRSNTNHTMNEDEIDEKVEILYKQANKFALAAHLSWGIWALVQARYSKIDFDYSSYSKLRLGEYHKRKNEFLAL